MSAKTTVVLELTTDETKFLIDVMLQCPSWEHFPMARDISDALEGAIPGYVAVANPMEFSVKEGYFIKAKS